MQKNTMILFDFMNTGLSNELYNDIGLCMNAANCRVFSLEEASLLLPFISQHMRRIFAINHQIKLLTRKLKNQDLSLDIKHFDFEDFEDAMIAHDFSTLKILLQGLESTVDAIKEKGLHVYSLEDGKICIPACPNTQWTWQIGEKTISFYKNNKEKFNNRRPVAA